MMLCGATLFGAKRAHFAGVPTHSPPGNAGDASRHTRSKAPFPAPSVVHLPGRLLPGFHHPRLSKSACPVLSPRQRFSNMKPQSGRFVKRGAEKILHAAFQIGHGKAAERHDVNILIGKIHRLQQSVQRGKGLQVHTAGNGRVDLG